MFADHLILIDDGKIVADGSQDRFTANLRVEALENFWD